MENTTEVVNIMADSKKDGTEIVQEDNIDDSSSDRSGDNLDSNPNDVGNGEEMDDDGDVNNDEAPDGSDSDDIDGKRKRKRRRGRHKGGKHHKKWKPYTKMSWSERQVADERESKRANLKREAAFASGHPVAPYNTTQYLMEDHIQIEAISPDLHSSDNQKLLQKDVKEEFSGSESSKDDEYIESHDEEESFMVKEFSETYDNIHVERLKMMSKEELIKDYIELEKKLEVLEDRESKKKSRPCMCRCRNSPRDSDRLLENSPRNECSGDKVGVLQEIELTEKENCNF